MKYFNAFKCFQGFKYFRCQNKSRKTYGLCTDQKKSILHEVAKAFVVLIFEFHWSYESVGVEAGIENSNHKKSKPE